jgi:hypothetical protein
MVDKKKESKSAWKRVIRDCDARTGHHAELARKYRMVVLDAQNLKLHPP